MTIKFKYLKKLSFWKWKITYEKQLEIRKKITWDSSAGLLVMKTTFPIIKLWSEGPYTRIMFYKERSKVMYSCQFWFLYSRSLICTLLFVQSFLKLKFRFSRSFKEFFFINMFIRKNLHYIYSLLKTGNITNYNRIIIRRIKCIFSYILAIFL